MGGFGGGQPLGGGKRGDGGIGPILDFAFGVTGQDSGIGGAAKAERGPKPIASPSIGGATTSPVSVTRPGSADRDRPSRPSVVGGPRGGKGL